MSGVNIDDLLPCLSNDTFGWLTGISSSRWGLLSSGIYISPCQPLPGLCAAARQNLSHSLRLFRSPPLAHENLPLVSFSPFSLLHLLLLFPSALLHSSHHHPGCRQLVLPNVSRSPNPLLLFGPICFIHLPLAIICSPSLSLYLHLPFPLPLVFYSQRFIYLLPSTDSASVCPFSLPFPPSVHLPPSLSIFCLPLKPIYLPLTSPPLSFSLPPSSVYPSSSTYHSQYLHKCVYNLEVSRGFYHCPSGEMRVRKVNELHRISPGIVMLSHVWILKAGDVSEHTTLQLLYLTMQ